MSREDVPSDRPPYACPPNFDLMCRTLSITASQALRALEMPRFNFLTSCRDWAASEAGGLGNPTVEDLVGVFRQHRPNMADSAQASAWEAWAVDTATAAIGVIHSKRRAMVEQAERQASLQAEREEVDRIKAERQAAMQRSEFEKQSVLAKEAQAAKWAAFEAEQDEFLAWKAARANEAEIANTRANQSA